MRKYFRLKCKIEGGMFPNDRCVAFKNADGKTVNGIFPESYIENNRLKVIVYKRKGNLALIGTSGGDSAGFGFINSSSRVWVNKQLLG